MIATIAGKRAANLDLDSRPRQGLWIGPKTAGERDRAEHNAPVVGMVFELAVDDPRRHLGRVLTPSYRLRVGKPFGTIECLNKTANEMIRSPREPWTGPG
jgi:hypothetical protein